MVRNLGGMFCHMYVHHSEMRNSHGLVSCAFVSSRIQTVISSDERTVTENSVGMEEASAEISSGVIECVTTNGRKSVLSRLFETSESPSSTFSIFGCL